MQLLIVGCGAVGSQFAVEMAKRLYANKLATGTAMHLYDFDIVEERNCAAQVFSPAHLQKNKAVVMASIVEEYGIETTSHPIKVTESTPLIMSNDYLLVDAVDNLTTRRLLYTKGVVADVPILHLAINENGEGQVTWTTKWTDSFPFGPLKMTEAQVKAFNKRPKPEVPPCELSYMRGMIFNTAFTGVEAVWQAMGMDNYSDGPAISSYMTTGKQVSLIATHKLDKSIFGAVGSE